MFFSGSITPAAADPGPTPPTSTVGDEKPPVWDVSGRVGYGINSWLQDLTSSALDPVLSLLGQTILSTPHVERHPRVKDLWRFSLGVADAVLILLILASAAVIVTGGLNAQITAKELLPRLLLGGAAANLSVFLISQILDFSNALSVAILGSAAGEQGLGAALSERLFSAGSSGVLFVIFTLVVVVLAVLVLISYVVRVAVLVILVIAAPLLLITHASPQLDHVARGWWRLVAGLIGAPVIQAILVAATLRVFLSSDGVLGLADGGTLIDLLVIGCLLYLLYRVPLWTIHVALGGAGARAWSNTKQQISVAVKAVTAA